MRIPPLCTLATPWAPIWVNLELDPPEVPRLLDTLALIRGINGVTGMIEPLGTGVIVGATDSVYILTALHILTGFADHTFGPAPRTAFTGLGDELDDKYEVQYHRMERLIDERHLRVVVTFQKPDELVELIVWNGSGGVDERHNDIVLLQCRRERPDADPYELCRRVRSLPLDFDPIDLTEPMVMTGLVGGQAVPFDKQPELTAAGVSTAIVRAGYVKEIVENPDGGRPGSTLWRVGIPSISGMSGGALIRLRYPLGQSVHVLGAALPQVLTLVGIVSRERLSSGLLAPFECPEGETWVTPVTRANVTTRHDDGKILQFGEELANAGFLLTYDDVRRQLAETPMPVPSTEALRVRMNMRKPPPDTTGGS